MTFGYPDGRPGGAPRPSRAHVFGEHLAQALGKEPRARLADGLASGAAEDALGGLIEERDAALLIEREDRVHRAFDDARQSLLVFLEPLFELVQGEMRPHPREHLLVLEGFGDVIDGAELEAPELIHRVGERGHEDDRDVPGVGTLLEPAAGLEAIDPRHEHIEQDQIRARVIHLLEGAGTILGDPKLETRLGKDLAQYRQVGRGIIDHQDGESVSEGRVHRTTPMAAKRRIGNAKGLQRRRSIRPVALYWSAPSDERAREDAGSGPWTAAL